MSFHNNINCVTEVHQTSVNSTPSPTKKRYREAKLASSAATSRSTEKLQSHRVSFNGEWLWWFQSAAAGPFKISRRDAVGPRARVWTPLL